MLKGVLADLQENREHFPEQLGMGRHDGLAKLFEDSAWACKGLTSKTKQQTRKQQGKSVATVPIRLNAI
jgi:hypothetical protein